MYVLYTDTKGLQSKSEDRVLYALPKEPKGPRHVCASRPDKFKAVRSHCFGVDSLSILTALTTEGAIMFGLGEILDHWAEGPAPHMVR